MSQVPITAAIEKDTPSLSSQQKELELSHIEEVPAHERRAVHVKNAAWLVAKSESKLSPWTKESAVLFLCCFTAFLTTAVTGYDGTLMTSITGMPYFTQTINQGAAPSSTGLIFSMYQIGAIVSTLFAGPAADRLGRRGGLMLGCTIVVLGAIVICTSHGRSQFIAGRFILGFATTFLIVSGPTYCVELAPPQWRGRMTAFYNTGWYSGAIPAAGVCLGTLNIPSDWSWRIPLLIQGIPALVCGCIVLFLPESPRFLAMTGRDEDAMAFLVKYHGNGNLDDPLVKLEFDEFKESIQTTGSDKRWWDYSDLYKTSNARWRTAMAIGMGITGNFSGNGLQYFALSIYEALGYDTNQQFELNLGCTFMAATGSFFGMSLADVMPRRLVLVCGLFFLSCCLFANGALSHAWATSLGHENLNVARAGVASYFLFNMGGGFTITPMQSVYPSECLSTNARAKGQSVYNFATGIMSFINLYAGPVALANIQYNYVFFFAAFDVFQVIMWYLFAVETLGRTLEELDEIFSAKYPVTASKRKNEAEDVTDDV
ncbi:putative MFS lactose permease [Calocera viscosa TUFC12733]|uniref:Putative MFS lactose permease n=1 Tax=Calocera viscosa (strain TUFC12733) TaxID=1330018 RepID=A0A167GEN4_CALVF|nr:putative MFS lactose permease [Calocera viscosa TUFC12733]